MTGEGVTDFFESMIRITINGIEAKKARSKAKKAAARKKSSFLHRKW